MTSRTDVTVRAAVVLALVAVGAVLVAAWDDTRRQLAALLAPALAIALTLTLAALVAWFVWHVAADPTRRLAHAARDALDYRRERARLTAELARRVRALDEELQVRALAASARVHDSASRAVSNANLRRELDDLKDRSEQVVRRAQSLQLAQLLARYEAATLKLQQAEHMTAAEKAALLADLRRLLADDAPPDAYARA